MAKATGTIEFTGIPAEESEIIIDDGQSNGGFSQVYFHLAGTATGGGEASSGSLGGHSRNTNASSLVNLYSTHTANKGFFRIAWHINPSGIFTSGTNAEFKKMATGGATPLIYEFGDADGNFVNITLVNESSGFTADVSGASYARKDSAGNYSINVNSAGVDADNMAEEIKDILAAARSAGEINISAPTRESTYWLQFSSQDAGDSPMSFRIKRASGSWTSTDTPAATVTKGTSTASTGVRARLFAPEEVVYAQRHAETGGSGTLTTTEFANYFARMLNGLQLQISASVSGDTVSLTNDNHGTDGNVTITTEGTTNATISGMSGGAAEGGGPAVAKRLKISARQIAISGSGGLSGSADGKSALMLDIAGLSAASIAQSDVLAFADADDSELNNRPKKITFSNFEDAIFGNISGDATVAAGGALTIANDAIESGMLNDNVISGQTELASDGLAAADELLISDGGTLKKIGVDNFVKDGLGLLSAEAVAVGSDHIVFLDGGATGDAKVESIADLATAMAAGAGLAASSGVIGVDGVLEDLDTLGAASADGEIIVATGAGAFAYESGATLRTTIGVGTGDSPVFTDLTLTGDLIVGGTTTSINVTNLHVEDTIIGLGISGSTEGSAGDRGLIMHIASETNPAMFWDESEDEFAFVRTNASGSATAITTDAYADLHVNAIDVDAASTIASLKVEDLTSGRVVLAGTGGEIEDSANMTFDGSQLTVTGHISASSNIYANGAVTASFFSGDGSALTGVGASVAEASAGGDAGANALQLTFVSGAASAASFFINSGSLQWRPSSDTLETVNISGSGGLDIAGTADFGGAVNVQGLLSGSGGLDIAGAADFGAAVNVQGLLSGSGGMDMAGTADFGAAVNVQGLLSGSGGMDMAGTADFGAAVNIQGLLSGSGGMDMAGTADFGGAVNIQGLLKPDGATDSSFDTSKSLFFRDSDGSMKRDSFSDIMAAAAGAGIQDASGVLSVKSRQDVFTLTASIGLSGSGPLVMKETPATTGSVMVFFNGLLQTQAVDYSLGGTGNKTVSLKGANTLAAEDEVVIKYIKS